MLKVNIVESKTVLVQSKLPSDDFVINPYSGCAFGCIYCYADFTRRFSGHLKDEWGEYVDVRINAPEVLDKEIKKLIRKMKSSPSNIWKNGKYPMILMSSVTDPYQGAESKYKVTRGCITVLVENSFEGELSILTKSALVTRDIDLFKKLKRVSVGLTITSTNDETSRFFEKNAPLASTRIQALKKLNDAGIKTYVCINPLLPHFADKDNNLEELFAAIKNAGTNEVFVEHLNLSGKKKSRIKKEITRQLGQTDLVNIWNTQEEEYKRELETVIYNLLDKYKIQVLAGGIIDHEKIMKKGTKFVMR
ncbi:radical SAM protein [Candidatus Dojkabacteria bacterium]|uniref:Radical SAM protein n=1 Tax=Candidatus Dojkabacteria bacterium TaxID=2099670 RepID=A0A955RHS9_9BACT|nr:radical SAM protein [Candidatus Dojkabacteria bacterium]